MPKNLPMTNHSVEEKLPSALDGEESRLTFADAESCGTLAGWRGPSVTVHLPANAVLTASSDSLKEEHDLLVEELPDAVEERVAHGAVAAADAGVDLGAGEQQLDGGSR